MTSQNMRLAAVAGGIAVVAAGFFVLGRGDAPKQGAHPSRGRSPATSTNRVVADAPARPAAGSGARTVAVPASNAAAKAASEVVLRARALFRRLESAAGRPATLPEDLRSDLLAFLNEGEESREALFRMAWDPGAPRMVLGHLKLFLLNLEDSGSRTALLASLESYDPMSGIRAEVAGKARDPSLLAAEIRAMAGGEPKVQRLHMIPKESLRNDAVKELLLETARDDLDETVRSAAYAKLAEGAVPEAPAIFLEAASDPGRSARERQMAAYALALHPSKAPADSRE